MDTDQRILNAIKFFRAMQAKSDSIMYRKQVLKFCDLVQEHMEECGGGIVKEAERIFGQ